MPLARVITTRTVTVAGLVGIAAALVWPICGGPNSRASQPAAPAEQEFFDDFSYAGLDDPGLAESGWIVFDGLAIPGPVGSRWNPALVSFEPEDGNPGNVLLRLSAATHGTGESSEQSSVATAARFFEGTYVARIRFTDEPRFGVPQPSVQAFFTISGLRFEYDPLYSECDFEYLPYDVWRYCFLDTTLYATTWETYRPCPRDVSKETGALCRSFAGWRVCSITIMGGQVVYRVDDELLAAHGGDNYPESLMQIGLNHWFSHPLSPTKQRQAFAMDVDWVYHVKDREVSCRQAEEIVEARRQSGLSRLDTMPPAPIPTPDPSSVPQAERCDNGLDDDGDGLPDCADPECVGEPRCQPTLCGCLSPFSVSFAMLAPLCQRRRRTLGNLLKCARKIR